MKTIALPEDLIPAARQLGRDGVLLDPTDGEILTAAAELAGYPPGRLTRAEQEEIVDAWEAGNEVYEDPPVKCESCGGRYTYGSRTACLDCQGRGWS